MSLLTQGQTNHDILMSAQSCEYVFTNQGTIRLSKAQIKTLYHRLLKDNVRDHSVAYQYALQIARG